MTFTNQLSIKISRVRSTELTFSYTSESFRMGILPYADIFRSDPALGLHCCSLDHGQRGTSRSVRTHVHEVPVRGVAVVRRVLTHWSDPYPVVEKGISNLERFEYCGDL